MLKIRFRLHGAEPQNSFDGELSTPLRGGYSPPPKPFWHPLLSMPLEVLTALTRILIVMCTILITFSGG